MNNFKAKSLPIALSLLIAVLAAPAFAATETANLEVSADVIDNCLISTSPLDFGNYDPVGVNFAAPLDSTGGVSITCTLDAAVAITLGQGLNPDGASTDAAPLRQMSDGSTELAYNLYTDVAGGTVWGNDASSDVPDTGTGVAENFTVFGRVAPGQNVPAGAYVDTVVATVTF